MALLPLADEEAICILESVPEDRRNECWWVVLREGTLVAGDHGGGVALMLELRLTHPIGRMFSALRLSPVIDVLDKILAHQRGRLSRLVPDGPAPRRYP
jgi:hypothetical protein